MCAARSVVQWLVLGISATAGCRLGSPAAAPVDVAISADPGRTLPPEVTAVRVATGDSLFNNGACQRCHGAGGVGGPNAPSLTAGPWLHGAGSHEDIARVVTTGIPREQLKDSSRRFAMNPRGGPMNLTDEQVKAVAAYVWTISRTKR